MKERFLIRKSLSRITLYTFMASLILGSVTLSCTNTKTSSDTAERISKQGEYVGYSEAIYADDYAMSSQYVEMRDGTKLAVDIYRPKDKESGEVVDTPLPVLWMHTPYNRRFNDNRQETMTIENYAGTAAQLIKYGYVVATADFRGLFASYGHNQGYNRGEWISTAQYDAYDITEWLAVQPWSNGNIGMWGCSATGGSQMQAATTAPPHLKAMFPMSFEFDVYDFRVPGGISNVREPRPTQPGQPTAHERRDAYAALVDGDTDSTQLKEAFADHVGTIESEGLTLFRDSYSRYITDEVSKQWWIRSSPSNYLDNINKSGIAMYMAVNWDEGATKPGPFFAVNNFTIPRKLVIGPGVHCDWGTSMYLTGFDIVTEELRFFDYWLKGIDNGIMDEDPIYYFTYNAPEGEEWQTSTAWPLPEEKRVDFYLGDGTLSSTVPAEPGKDETTVTYDFRPGVADPSGAIIYETEPLTEDMQITGHPTINLWVSSTATDGDFVATLQDVAPDGTVSSYNVQGQLRASMRELADAPYDNLGLPYHSFMEADDMPLVPGEPTELYFKILPISMIIKAGHKLQLAISFAGRGTTRLDEGPEVTIYRDAQHQSFVTLPIVEL
ncbi:MAG TPA: CocE/NonD family hydrolase [Draconibacterium sp.]|nr:CocE/NonD family hydrolase [Draconibacterium sp.]